MEDTRQWQPVVGRRIGASGRDVTGNLERHRTEGERWRGMRSFV
jgi:hypothetical protein